MTDSASDDPLIALVPAVDGHRMLGPCRLQQRIGMGAMGLVYKGHHQKLDIDVAIKIMAPHLAGDAGAVARFVREAQIVARIRHANLVQIYDVDSAHGLHYIIMEWIEGHSAHEELKQVGKFPLDTALNLVYQAGLGMAAAHELGYVHRDIKPANILMGMQGEIKVVDLGVAKILQENTTESGLTATGATVGTPAFMSPEQCQDASQCGTPTDVYSLAATLFTLLTGKPPFDGKNVFEVCMQVVTKPFPALPADLKPPAGLNALLKKATAREPAQRYANAAEFAEAVAALLNRPGGSGTQAPSIKISARRPTAGVTGRTTRRSFENEPQAAAAPTQKTPKSEPAPEPAAPSVDVEAILAEAKQAERQNEMEKVWTLLQSAATQAADQFEPNFRVADLVLRQKWKERFDAATAFAQIAVNLGEKDRDQSYNSRRVLAGLQALKRSLEQFDRYIQQCDQLYRDLKIEAMKQPLAEAENLQPKHSDLDRAKAQYEAGQRFVDGYTTWLKLTAQEQWTAAMAQLAPMESFTISHPNVAVQRSFGLVKQLTQILGGLGTVSPDGNFVMVQSHLSQPADLVVQLESWRTQAATSVFRRLRDFVEAGGLLTRAEQALAALRNFADRSDKRLAGFESWFQKVHQARAGRAPGELIVALQEYQSWVHLCGFAFDGTVLATASDDHKLYLHDLPSGQSKIVIDYGRKPLVTVCEPSKSQKVVVVGLSNGALHQYDIDTGTEAVRGGGGGGLGRLFGLGGKACFYNGHGGEIVLTRFSPDGLSLLSASLDKSLRFWDAFNGQERKRFTDSKAPAVGLEFAPSGAQACLADEKGGVFVYDLNAVALQSQFDVGKPIRKAVFTQTLAIVLDQNGRVGLWDLAKGKFKADLATKGAAVQDVVLSPDRQWLLTVGRETVARLWKAETGAPIGEYAGHAAALRSGAFSDNGRWLVTFGMQGEARVWETATGHEMYTLKGHSGLILKAAFSPDQRWIVTVSEDHSARVWSAGLPPDAPKV